MATEDVPGEVQLLAAPGQLWLWLQVQLMDSSSSWMAWACLSSCSLWLQLTCSFRDGWTDRRTPRPVWGAEPQEEAGLPVLLPALRTTPLLAGDSPACARPEMLPGLRGSRSSFTDSDSCSSQIARTPFSPCSLSLQLQAQVQLMDSSDSFQLLFMWLQLCLSSSNASAYSCFIGKKKNKPHCVSDSSLDSSPLLPVPVVLHLQLVAGSS
ncbi:uncharacterized protein LOC142055929 isoform X2 [Phalacrocorax aristotelis]|uniref:uncharacterized protein LOC142055929 isoform X2 n=1 Tax=Phalacrocorax aristotelis TaxID=126867 RepID=UPI003F4B3AF6